MNYSFNAAFLCNGNNSRGNKWIDIQFCKSHYKRPGKCLNKYNCNPSVFPLPLQQYEH